MYGGGPERRMLHSSDYMRDSSNMRRDPLSSVLSVMNARVICASGITAGERRAMRFPAPDTIKFFVVAKGDCFVSLDGTRRTYSLRQGDVFLLSMASSFVLATHQDVSAANGAGLPWSDDAR